MEGNLQRDHACGLLWTLPHVISGVLGVEVGHWGRVGGGGVKVPRSEPPLLPPSRTQDSPGGLLLSLSLMSLAAGLCLT